MNQGRACSAEKSLAWMTGLKRREWPSLEIMTSTQWLGIQCCQCMQTSPNNLGCRNMLWNDAKLFRWMLCFCLVWVINHWRSIRCYSQHMDHSNGKFHIRPHFQSHICMTDHNLLAHNLMRDHNQYHERWSHPCKDGYNSSLSARNMNLKNIANAWLGLTHPNFVLRKWIITLDSKVHFLGGLHS